MPPAERHAFYGDDAVMLMPLERAIALIRYMALRRADAICHHPSMLPPCRFYVRHAA